MKRAHFSIGIMLLALLGANLIATASTNYFTEYFSGDFDLGGLSMLFNPVGGSNYYEVIEVQTISELPFDTSPYPAVTMDYDVYYPVNISGNSVHLYGTSYNSFWVLSSGYIDFLADIWYLNPSLNNHFDYPRVAPYYTDLDPSAGGEVKIFELVTFGVPRGMVVSFENVPRFNNPGVLCSFQCIMYYTGPIQMAWLHTSDPGHVIVGLSSGNGTPLDYQETDLSDFAPPPPGDQDRDGLPDSWEAFYFTHYTNCDPDGNGDSDDYDNESEYIAGTDPTDSSSYFNVGSSMGTSHITLNWHSLTGRVYSIQRTDSLKSPFTNLVTGIIPTPPLNSYAAPIGQENGFFKAGVEMAP